MAVRPIFTDRFSLPFLVLTRDGDDRGGGDIGKLIPRPPRAAGRDDVYKGCEVVSGRRRRKKQRSCLLILNLSKRLFGRAAIET